MTVHWTGGCTVKWAGLALEQTLGCRGMRWTIKMTVDWAVRLAVGRAVSLALLWAAGLSGLALEQNLGRNV